MKGVEMPDAKARKCILVFAICYFVIDFILWSIRFSISSGVFFQGLLISLLLSILSTVLPVAIGWIGLIALGLLFYITKGLAAFLEFDSLVSYLSSINNDNSDIGMVFYFMTTCAALILGIGFPIYLLVK